ncbi:MAG: hypothetical protein ABSG93_09960 [Solirubrobacteraceae bacterium]|jgi:hypothetical protein
MSGIHGGIDRPGMTRRTLLQRAVTLGVGASTLGALEVLGLSPERAAATGSRRLPEIQFDIEKHLAPAFKVDRVKVRFAPVYTTFATFTLSRAPTLADRSALATALARVEAIYPFAPSGVFTTIAYGIPYFEQLPGGMSGELVASHMPRLLSEPSRFALEEAVPGPTDVSPANPGVTKERFQVPVAIESNDVLLTLRSDSLTVIDEILAWLSGETEQLAGVATGPSQLAGLFTATSRRLMFNQRGLPRLIAEEHELPYVEALNPESNMWMGFVDQQVGSSGPPPIVTFAGKGVVRLTTALPGDYFDDGSVVHLSHLIQDLEQFYARPGETYERRVAEMFSSAPPPNTGNADQFTDGGGPAFVRNEYLGTTAAEREARGSGTFDGQPHIGHTTALQRTSRTFSGVPLHIRADGPGYDTLDVPDGSAQPKLHFSIFVPTAEQFATMRRSQASLDLAQRFSVPQANLGLERFITATRRQNFLVPPRRNRAFPLLELA